MPTATWVIPVVTAAFAGLVGVVQWNIQHANAERLAEIQRDNAAELAKIGDDLRRNTIQFERRLNAFVAATTAMRFVIDIADGLIRSDGIFPGPGGTLPTRVFYEQTLESRRTIQTSGEILRLLITPEVVADLDQFEEILKSVDLDDDRDSLHANDIDVAGENIDALTSALPKLRSAHEVFLKNGRADLEVK